MRIERWWHILPLRFQSLLRSRRAEADLDDELRFHLEERAREFVARGMSEREARDAALRVFGGLAQRKEEMRDARRVGWIEDALRDIAFAFRLMRRSPGVTAVAVVSLALAIGANTAMFTVVDAVQLRTLPVPDVDRLVFVESTGGFVTLKQFEHLRQSSTVFESTAAVWSIDRFNLAARGADGEVDIDSSPVRVAMATAGYFKTLGIDPAVGRMFTQEEDRATSDSVAVISDAYWRRRFEGRDVLGRTLRLHDVSYTIIGIAPRGFTGEWVGLPVDVWVPFEMASLVMPEVPGGPGRFPRLVLARLGPGVTIDESQAATDVLYQQVLAKNERSNVRLRPAAKGYSPQRTAYLQPLAILSGGVGVLLLIACANLANLLMARAAARQREMAVRRAVGAGRGRLARQIVAESLVLAAAGGVLGIVVATWAEGILATLVAAGPVSMAGQGAGLLLDLRFDARAIAFTIALIVVTGLLFGIAPALFASRAPLSGTLAESNVRVIGAAGRFGPSSALVTVQIALSFLLLVGAGLFLRTLANLRAESLGIERERTLLVWTVPGQTGRQDAAMADFWHAVQERLSRIPGVVSVAASNQSVLSGNIFSPSTKPSYPMTVVGEELKPSVMPGFRSFITPGFFTTLGVPFVAGRDFTERDHETAPRVVILNESMARFYFGERNPTGRIVNFSGSKDTPFEVVGVTRDFVKGSPRAGAQAEFATYFPYRDPEALNRGAQTRLRVMLVVLQTTGNPLAVAERVREELRTLDPELPVLRINTPAAQLDDVLAQDRLIAALSSSFGALAVLLAGLGLFGLISYRVARRTNEIGVRLALGATPSTMLAMVFGEGGRLVAAGLALGLSASVAAARFVSSQLFGISATDPWTLAGAALFLTAVAALAALVPARRASRVDPMVALRCD